MWGSAANTSWGAWEACETSRWISWIFGHSDTIKYHVESTQISTTKKKKTYTFDPPRLKLKTMTSRNHRYRPSHSHFNSLHHPLLTICHPLLTPSRWLKGGFSNGAHVVIHVVGATVLRQLCASRHSQRAENIILQASPKINSKNRTKIPVEVIPIK